MNPSWSCGISVHRSNESHPPAHPHHSAVTRIVQNDSAYMDSPDIVKAQTTLEERPYLEEKLKGHTVRVG